MEKDFSIEFALEIDKISAMEELLMNREKTTELSSEALYGIGLILRDASTNLTRMYEALYGKEA